MEEQFNFTDESLRLLRWAGIPPAVVWSALQADHWLRRPLGDREMNVFCRAATGEHLVVGLIESHDDDWDITGARLMEPDEIARFEREQRGER